jgi:putative redox protein
MDSSVITMDVYQNEPFRFITKTPGGVEIIAEPGAKLGGSGAFPNPLEYYISALGSCVGIKLQIELTKRGYSPESIAITMKCTRASSLPDILETIHLIFSVSGNIDREQVSDAIHEVMTLTCPVAVMVSRAVPVTWEC